MTAGNHTPDLRQFWHRLQTGVSLAVAGPTPEKLLGIRDGVQRYFRDHLGRDPSVAVVPQPRDDGAAGLPISDEEAFALAHRRVREVAQRVGSEYHFCVASEGTLDVVEVGGTAHWFVHNWTVVTSPVGEAWGGSGSVELPPRLVSGLGHEQVEFAIPGTRRGGGMMASITGGVEDRRRATALATTNALSTLFYGMLEGRPGHRRS
jgi:non-canonical (house-cleaning) NTP pyrophosphatase